jgi:two-component system, cell cycle sensor histidine kinase and response regulator CckA
MAIPSRQDGLPALNEIIDISVVQSLMDDAYHLTDVGVALVDLQGKVLVASGWQEICTKFHRTHPQTRKYCMENDLQLSSSANSVPFTRCRCKNNIWEMVAPITIDGAKMGSLFVGQFFPAEEPPDEETFRQQARQYNFNEAEYMAALAQVPRWSEEKITEVMALFAKLADIISRLGLSSLQLQQTLQEKQALLDTLERSERRYRFLLDRAAEAVVVIQDGYLKFANPRVAELTGQSQKELLSRPFTEFIHPDDAPIVTKRHQQRMRGFEAPALYAFRLQQPNGETRWVEMKAALIEWEGSPATLNFMTDITEHKLAEAALRDSEKRHRQLLESIQDSVCVLDPEWRHVMVNDAAVRLTGIPREMLLANKLTDLFPGVEDTPFFASFAQSMITRTATVVENEYHFADGRRGWYQVQVYPVPQGILCISRDITDQKRMQEEQEKLHAQLQQAQKMEAVGQLAGGVAHDFNNMLTGILGYAALALEEAEEGTSLHTNLEEIQSAAQRSADLTGQLLAFARRQTVQPRVLDLNKLVHNTLKLLRRLIPEEIELTWLPGAGLWRVKMDAVQVDQILTNLTVNARDAITGAGQITIETDNGSVNEMQCAGQVDCSPGDYVILTVNDTGHGMDAETLAHIFEPFFTTKQMNKGTGMGLATVYGIIKQNGGFVNVYSEPDIGTAFRIYLPRCTEVDEAPRPSRALPDTISSGNETVLFVEDEPALLRLGNTLLGRLGYTVLSASLPTEALELAESYDGDIHLLMTDVVMPEMNGSELAEQVRALRPGIKALFTSGYTASVVARRGVVDEEVPFIQKPFVLPALAAKLREVLDG